MSTKNDELRAAVEALGLEPEVILGDDDIFEINRLFGNEVPLEDIQFVFEFPLKVLELVVTFEDEVQ